MNEFIKEHYVLFLWVIYFLSYYSSYFYHRKEIKSLKRIIEINNKYIKYLQNKNEVDTVNRSNII